eukprot:Platyproteum_vivax@DN611_c0_g1_i1.p1
MHIATLETLNENTAHNYQVLRENLPIVVGRDVGCGIRLADKQVASRHFKIIGSQDKTTNIFKFSICNISRDSTFLNGASLYGLGWVSLSHGDKIELTKLETRPQDKIQYTFQIPPVAENVGRPEEQGSSSSSLTNQPAKRPAEFPLVKETGANYESQMLEESKCPLCLEVLYRPVMVVPCSHSACAGCFFKFKISPRYEQKCFVCRGKVTTVCKNLCLSSLIDTFLVQFPQYVRNQKEKHALENLEKKLWRGEEVAVSRATEEDSSSSDSESDDSSFSSEAEEIMQEVRERVWSDSESDERGRAPHPKPVIYVQYRARRTSARLRR